MPTNVPQTNEQKAYEIGKRLSEKSTYTGLTMLVSMALPLLIKIDPHLAGTSTDSVVSAVSYFGMGIGAILTILFKENGSKAVIAFLIGTAALLAGTRVISPADAAPVAHKRVAAVPLPKARPAAVARPIICDPANLIPGCKPPQTPTTPTAAAANLSAATVKGIIATLPADISYAIAMASQDTTPAAKVRLQCYQAIQTALPPQPSGLAMPPAPHIVTNAEMLAEVIDTITPGSPVWVNCAGAAQLAGQGVLQFVNALVTGTAAVAVLAPKIP